jgi:hypothetical protein
MDPNPYQAPRTEPAAGKPQRPLWLTLTVALLVVLVVGVVGYGCFVFVALFDF